MGKTIGLAITGGISAYKIVDLASKLKKDGFEVVVMMTKGAEQFVSPLTFKTITGREVVNDLWNESQEYKVQHIDVAEEIDLLVVAPATANMIGKMANGIADDLISTVFLANTAPTLIVPSMNTNMLENPIVQNNIEKLKGFGVKVQEPDSGILACGVSGKGRLPEIDEIYNEILKILKPKLDLKGKKVMVNAGTTCEDIDPVRFIANRGTGKMGFSIAQAAYNRGADVILVSGKSPLEPPEGVNFQSVWGADEMCEVMLKFQPECDVIIGAAAVGDFKISGVAGQKMKKMEDESDVLTLQLVGTPDILKEIGKKKKDHQVTVGFAAETENIVENAKKKLESKNLDFIVANDVTMEGAGFASDTNIVTFITRDGDIVPLEKMTKDDVADAIIDKVVDLI
ncbi:Phosphopantothenoylcysteine decarboxylase [Candidatus Syntrophocurvum alkaliphilum]|uniref:Coenzyme A biosynthesis bifunctional protein CoaBC n=1 Tax=Candidatus Syntrophocurvum alkaliphilum TaxID=2293317 RepID=A0A6I6DJQ4_9FIRM|nr:bifunctional phosphopantothenoylcysteine decarboxylase/phosphopantothenate--cysteine ligase CoaBC [Candidatus Syntrophocurvum alkaliphilum]QGT99621.1 Phosphopantothenoylcysteine decarboxylase [Candidatus Syntrophocurvum alkaliphilum]